MAHSRKTREHQAFNTQIAELPAANSYPSTEVAETIIQPISEFRSSSVAATHRILPAFLRRGSIAAIATTILRKGLISFITMCFTFAFLYGYYTIEPTVQANAALQKSAGSKSFHVTAIDPNPAPVTAALNNSAEQTQAIPAFDINEEVKHPSASTASDNFALIEDAKIDSSGAFVAVGRAEARSELSKDGLRVIPDSNGRYLSARSDLEWQGGWQVENPAANVERGEKYMRYLEQKLDSNLKSPLAVREQGVSRLAEELPIAAAEKLPIQSYGK
ncbi:MAG: hypothetical protein K1X83_06385 [Oligoflexia bacterium]|nr:hypothetical protein [Oligoflexia bacterium]